MNKPLSDEPEQAYRITHDRMQRWAFERPEFVNAGYDRVSQTWKLMRHGDLMPANISRSRKPLTVRAKESKSYKPKPPSTPEDEGDRYEISRSIEAIVNDMPDDWKLVIAARYLKDIQSKSEIQRLLGIDRKAVSGAIRMILAKVDQQLDLRRMETT